jgi:hypothetical protein
MLFETVICALIVVCAQRCDMGSRVWYRLFETVICALIVMCAQGSGIGCLRQ